MKVQIGIIGAMEPEIEAILADLDALEETIHGNCE